MADPDPKRPPPQPTPPVEIGGSGPPAPRPEEEAGKEVDPASPAFDILDAGRTGAGVTSPPGPENLVAEIVDQITEKQARALRNPEVAPASAEVCAECLVAGIPATTPYRFVLRCTNDEYEKDQHDQPD